MEVKEEIKKHWDLGEYKEVEKLIEQNNVNRNEFLDLVEPNWRTGISTFLINFLYNIENVESFVECIVATEDVWSIVKLAQAWSYRQSGKPCLSEDNLKKLASSVIKKGTPQAIFNFPTHFGNSPILSTDLVDLLMKALKEKNDYYYNPFSFFTGVIAYFDNEQTKKMHEEFFKKFVLDFIAYSSKIEFFDEIIKIVTDAYTMRILNEFINVMMDSYAQTICDTGEYDKIHLFIERAKGNPSFTREIISRVLANIGNGEPQDSFTSRDDNAKKM